MLEVGGELCHCAPIARHFAQGLPNSAVPFERGSTFTFGSLL